VINQATLISVSILLGTVAAGAAPLTRAQSSPSAVAAAPVAAQPPTLPTLSPIILDRLREGDFAGAQRDFEYAAPIDRITFADDIRRIDTLVLLVQLAQSSAQQGHGAEVEALIGDLKQVAIPSAELERQQGVARQAQRLAEQLRESDAPAARASLALARHLEDQDDADGAAAIYKAMLDAPDSHLPELVQAARRANDSNRRSRVGLPRALANAKSALGTLLIWLAGFAAIALLLRLIQAVLGLFPHETPSVEVEDRDAEPSQRAFATREIVEHLLSREYPDDGPAIDALEDLDRSGLSNISLSMQDFDALQDIASSSDPISVAGFSFTPQQLYSLFLPLRRPYSREYSGTLSQDEAACRLTLRIRRARQVTWFRCQASTRQEALAEGADYIAFQNGAWKVSEKWRSFSSYRKALRLLSVPAQPDELMNNARELLEEAVGFDPRNVAAEYRLGTLLRRMGRNAEAAELLDRLSQQLADSARPSSVLEFVRRNPDFTSSVQYDLALCYAKQDSFPTLARAEKLLLLLEGKLEDSASQAPARFAMLANGALAAVFVGQMGLMLRAEVRPNKLLQRDQRILRQQEEIVKRRARLEACRRDQRLADPRTCASALAVALAAEGRAHFLLHHHEAAEEALRRAQTENPRLACALVNLAQVLKRKKNPEAVKEAMRLLERAIELSPRNSKAYYLLGNLHHYKHAEHAVAAELLEKARAFGSNSKTDLVYALCLTDLGRKHEALEVLERSMRAIEKPIDHRYERFLTLLSQEDALTPELKKTAGWCFGRVEKQEPRSHDYDRCLKYMVQIRSKPDGDLSA
jgi:tetratricopeptide (TPR) repeat protein